jgi:TRAP transporter TAXI family solute receptor
MSRSREGLTALVILVGVGAALAAGLTLLKPKPAELVISTGTPGGTYIILGDQLARIVDEYPGKEIGKVQAKPSAGTVENIARLTSGEAELALVVGPVFAGDPRRENVRALAVFYSDVLQIVVRKSASIEGLSGLKGKRVYVGADGSGTKWIATRILRTAEVSESDYSRVKVHSFQEAAAKLEAGKADAAFFMAATPVKAVSDALGSGCCVLLDLQHSVDSIMASVPGLKRWEIPPHVYENQPDPVQTLGASALLVGRKDLRDGVVLEVLDALFDGIGEFAVAHIRVQDIRLPRALNEKELPEGVEFHPGVKEFRERESKRLWIATGTINGKYYRVGKRMQSVLRQNGIPARAIHTDGSLENLKLLGGDSDNGMPTLAIVQYDVALASLWGDAIYRTASPGPTFDIREVKGLRRIATLHEEKVHVLVRRDRIPAQLRERPTLAVLRDLRVCVGPKDSGTQIVAQAVLQHHEVSPKQKVFLSVPDMVARIHSGEIDAGFFMSHVPSEALKTVVNDDRNRLLSIDPGMIAGLLGPALAVSRIEPGTYGAQREGEPPIDTVATWAVLTARVDLPFEVGRLTEVLFEGAAFLGIEGGADAMARDMSSLPLHPDAKAYYQEAGYLPAPPRIFGWLFDWLAATWRSLAILVILAGASTGLLKYRRDRTSNEIGRRILGIPLGAEEPDSVRRLLTIRGEIRKRVRQRWWQGGELDKPRWRYLYDLINDRITVARENLTLSLAEEIRTDGQDNGLDDAARQKRLRSLEERIWQYFEKGELDASRLGMLLELIRENIRQPTEAPVE